MSGKQPVFINWLLHNQHRPYVAEFLMAIKACHFMKRHKISQSMTLDRMQELLRKDADRLKRAAVALQISTGKDMRDVNSDMQGKVQCLENAMAQLSIIATVFNEVTRIRSEHADHQ